VRVIAATNRCLGDLVRQGKFREDLYYRINVVKINLPPLCRRPEDIVWLAAHFIAKHARSGEAAKQITAPALDALLHYSWPGNIRELENAIERACVMSGGRFIDVGDLPPELITQSKPLGPFSVDFKGSLTAQVRDAVAQIESQYIRNALAITRGHVGRCARICGLSRRSITLKIAKYQLDRLAFNGD
jgi:two-component system response regulator AtoC